ncbi:EH domain-containing protein 3-like [Watersipora subatra]|uniref:EH domain-containing protein 3-like n=1 Tax=Watersipora subatra TaxID=2589382 RepID=UPI00355C706C
MLLLYSHCFRRHLCWAHRNLVYGSCRHASSISSWIPSIFKKEDSKSYNTIRDGLVSMYKTSLEPLEDAYHFHEFHSPRLTAADFDYKPSVMLIGQYSTGKTTFLQHLVGKDYPGMRIGPEPTTDKFIVIMNGEEDSIVPGNALVVDSTMPYAPLAKHGNKFLNRFQASRTPTPVLENLTLIDTPGILSGEKQTIDRGYDFIQVVHWFAERVDRVVLLFDAHKLDISDEFMRVIQTLNMYEDKVRIVLNKSDRVNSQQLMRVYGALMWSLGKIMNTPEVVRVFIGSFWKQPLQHTANRSLFELEHQDLLQDLQALPKQNSLRKLNDFIRRTRLAKVHAYIIADLKSEMPVMFRKQQAKERLINELDLVYRRIQSRHNISPGDFPDMNLMKRKLKDYDFTSFKSLDSSLIDAIDDMLSKKIPPLMSLLPSETLDLNVSGISGGVFDLLDLDNNPFQSGGSEGVNEGKYDGSDEWVVSNKMPLYAESFRRMAGEDERITGAKARTELLKSNLPSTELALIWKLSDVDSDGYLDLEQWALANHLVNIRQEGHELPDTLPKHLLPPSYKKSSFNNS